METIAEL